MQLRSWLKKALIAALLIVTMAVPVYAEEEVKNGVYLNESAGVVECYKNGAIDTSVTDVVTFEGGRYYVEHGRGRLDFTGLFKSPSEGWVYIEDGKFREDLSGFTKNQYGSWYYENGRVRFDKTDIIKGELNGETAWWYIKGNKVRFVDSVEKNANGWWRIKKGKVDFSYTGIAKNSKGWWRIQKGKVNFKYNGIAKNENGYFMIKKGKVNWKYTGIAKYGKSNWYVKKGKVQKNYSGKIKVGNKTYQVKKGKITGTVTAGGAMDVKAQTYTSATRYLILVNRNNTKVGIYQRKGSKWDPVKIFPCCVGAKGSQTPTGKFRVGIKGLYFNTGSGGRCWNYTQIRGNVLFHSQIYDRQSAPNRVIDGRMNKWCSHGCIRLYLNDARWIYNNVPAGTTIVIY